MYLARTAERREPGATSWPRLRSPRPHRGAGALERALELYEGLGDRRGVMSTVIAMAYLSYGPDIHIGASTPRSGSRRSAGSRPRLDPMSRESERDLAEVQMLYGIHVYARAKMIPTSRCRAARRPTDWPAPSVTASIEFLAAGGRGPGGPRRGRHRRGGAVARPGGAAAAASPTPLRARSLEHVAGRHAAAHGDARRDA